jgi:hypothetical protein
MARRRVNLDGIKAKAEGKLQEAREMAMEAKGKTMAAANEARIKAQARGAGGTHRTA